MKQNYYEQMYRVHSLLNIRSMAFSLYKNILKSQIKIKLLKMPWVSMQYRSEFYTVNRQKIFFIALIEGERN